MISLIMSSWRPVVVVVDRYKSSKFGVGWDAVDVLSLKWHQVPDSWVLQCMGEVQTDAGRGYREMIKDQEVGTNCRHVGTIIHVAFKGPVKACLGCARAASPVSLWSLWRGSASPGLYRVLKLPAARDSTKLGYRLTHQWRFQIARRRHPARWILSSRGDRFLIDAEVEGITVHVNGGVGSASPSLRGIIAPSGRPSGTLRPRTPSGWWGRSQP